FNPRTRPGPGAQCGPSTAPTYGRNIKKEKSQKKSWYQYIFLGLAAKSLRLPIIQLHGYTPYLALISSACLCRSCRRLRAESPVSPETPISRFPLSAGLLELNSLGELRFRPSQVGRFACLLEKTNRAGDVGGQPPASVVIRVVSCLDATAQAEPSRSAGGSFLDTRRGVFSLCARSSRR